VNLFGRRKVEGQPTVVELATRLGAIESALRQLETEQLTLHDQVRKWMRRAVAAERVATREAPGTPKPGAPTPPPATGVRARRLANRLAEISGLTFDTPPPDTEANGAGGD
jgi:hypothetical protein